VGRHAAWISLSISVLRGLALYATLRTIKEKNSGKCDTEGETILVVSEPAKPGVVLFAAILSLLSYGPSPGF